MKYKKLVLILSCFLAVGFIFLMGFLALNVPIFCYAYFGLFVFPYAILFEGLIHVFILKDIKNMTEYFSTFKEW